MPFSRWFASSSPEALATFASPEPDIIAPSAAPSPVHGTTDRDTRVTEVRPAPSEIEVPAGDSAPVAPAESTSPDATLAEPERGSPPVAEIAPVPVVPAPPTQASRHAAGAGLTLGIGVITYRRGAVAAETIAAIRRFTRTPFQLVVADDGSGEEDQALLREAGPLIAGANRGVTWNKNRALFHLHAVCRCDVIILIEDDTRPTAPGWERAWIDAARHWGHVNYAGHWFRDRILAGDGTPEKPFVSHNFSGQCAAFSREALDYVGYLDTRYRGFGIGHVDHTYRLARTGYGAMRSNELGNLFYLIDSDLEILPVESARKEDDVKRNHALYQTLKHEGVYRNAWHTDAELDAFRAEQRLVGR